MPFGTFDFFKVKSGTNQPTNTLLWGTELSVVLRPSRIWRLVSVHTVTVCLWETASSCTISPCASVAPTLALHLQVATDSGLPARGSRSPGPVTGSGMCSQSLWEAMVLTVRHSVPHIPTGLKTGPKWVLGGHLSTTRWDSAENRDHALPRVQVRDRERDTVFIWAPGPSSMGNDTSLDFSVMHINKFPFHAQANLR